MADTVTTTTAGKVRGVEIPEGIVFRGIPFAAAPVGDGRYRPPVPPEPWNAIRDPVLGGTLGACHALELPFLFEILDDSHEYVGHSPPADLANALHRAWTRFAATGDPNGDELPAWPTYDTRRRPVLDFDTVRRVLDDPAGEERRLWDGVM
jgi:carboxylesterase type B